MRAIDTNLLVRLLTRDDEAQTERAEAFVESGAWVSHLVLVETVWVLESVFELDDERIARAVEMLLDHDRLTLQDPDVIRKALAAFRSGDAAELSDCMTVETARKAGRLPLGTFDRGLACLPDAELV